MEQDNKESNGFSVGWALKNPLEIVLCALLISMVSLTFMQVISRYVLGTSLAWSEELAKFIFFYLALLSCAYALKTRSHFALKFMVNAMPKTIQKIMALLVVLITALFLLVFTWWGVKYTIANSSQVAPGTGLPMSVPYCSLIVGGLLMLYYLIKNCLEDFRKPAEEDENPDR